MADEKEKRALLHEAILCKGKMSAMEKKYKEAKNALVALMEEDGDSSVETDDGRAFYKGASGTYLIDAQAISRTLNKDELVDLVAEKKITQGDANFLTTITEGRNISSVIKVVPGRNFIVEKARTKAEKERIQAAIDAETEKDMKELRKRVNEFRKRLGLGRSERLAVPKGKKAEYRGRKKSSRAK